MVLFGQLTSDPNLLTCELHRLAQEVSLGDPRKVTSAGLGWFFHGEPLLRHFGAKLVPGSLGALGKLEGSALVYQAGAPDPAVSGDEHAQPFRLRRWLFAHAGRALGHDRYRERLVSSLPKFLSRQIRGKGESEAAFALYLSLLWKAAHGEDRRLDLTTAARLLGETVRRLEELSATAGATRHSTWNLVATQGEVFVATRFGEEPLFWTLLEGSPHCELCRLDLKRAETQSLVRAHQRRRTLAIASHPMPDAQLKWVELPHGTCLAADTAGNVRQAPF